MNASSTPHDEGVVAVSRSILQAAEALARGNLPEAQRQCREVLETHPDHFDALNLAGFIAAQMGRTAEAVDLLARAVMANSESATAQVNYGNALKKLGRLEEALGRYEHALQLEPNHAEAHNNRGNTLQELRHFGDALRSYERALKIKPRFAQAYNNRGTALRELGRYEEALDSCTRALQIRADYAEAYNNRGVIQQKMQRLDEALKDYEHALRLRPDYAEAHTNRGNALLELKQQGAALESYLHSLRCKSDFAEAWHGRGNALRDLGRLEESLQSYEHALNIQPAHAEVYANRGNVLRRLGRREEALQCYERALEINPDLADAHNNRGVALQALQRFSDALQSFESALRLRPGYAEAYNNRGNTLRELGRFEDALRDYDQALQSKPGLAEAYNNRGGALRELKRFEEALDCYERALQLNPEIDWLYGAWMRTKLQLCDWYDLPAQMAQLLAGLERGQYSVAPFGLMAFCDSPALQRQAAQLWVEKLCLPCRSVRPRPDRARRARMRIGYYSSDFGDHPMAHLAAGLFEAHDRNRFEVIAFSSGPSRDDAMARRLQASFDQFLQVRGRTDQDIARVSGELEIDIAVDLMGFTANARTGVFAERAAPIQVSYLGYPGTMAAPYIDYLIADATVIPPRSQAYYAEKIVYLPHSFQVNDRKRVISDYQYPREELGLPASAFVFCCFNGEYKFNPQMFDCWMRILSRVEGSVLWLAGSNATAMANLRREAATRSVAPERLLFAGRLPRAQDHLARLRAADLFLDTYPFNAHTTASDALWAGLPLLTRAGEGYPARVAASLLHAIGLPELVVATCEQYEHLAVALANNPAKLGELRKRLNQNLLTSPLFDTVLFTRHLEDAYLQMYARYVNGQAPDHIHVGQ